MEKIDPSEKSPGKHTHGGAEEEKSQRRGGVTNSTNTNSNKI